jgi:hypothetical protein
MQISYKTNITEPGAGNFSWITVSEYKSVTAPKEQNHLNQ